LAVITNQFGSASSLGMEILSGTWADYTFAFFWLTISVTMTEIHSEEANQSEI
jgi:hypothetical protein